MADERDKNEAKEVSRCLVRQGLGCQASGWISDTGEKSEFENRKRLSRLWEARKYYKTVRAVTETGKAW